MLILFVDPQPGLLSDVAVVSQDQGRVRPARGARPPEIKAEPPDSDQDMQWPEEDELLAEFNLKYEKQGETDQNLK